MPDIFVTSDHHFGHANILTFENNGQLLRPEFANVDEMDEHMIEMWNKTVPPRAKVYHLGDFTMHRRFVAKYAHRLTGELRIVLGNHDDDDMRTYQPYVPVENDEGVTSLQYRPLFKKVFSSRRLDDFLFTHIPVHPLSLKPGQVNVHGHVHNNVPQGFFGRHYYNVSVEMHKYCPVPLETIRQYRKQAHAFDENERIFAATMVAAQT
jgi:calcineurin-like phosphoesterase family protein